MSASVSRETPPERREAALPLLRRYEAALAGAGIERGLIGPREADRLWTRHILNCAVVAWREDLVPPGATVVDVGSGAGLPGLVWALARPDLTVTLVESLQRRTEFLQELVDALALTGRVRVTRARAEAMPRHQWQVATARAVAPLPKLLPWLAPLLVPGGVLLAFKGAGAAQEVTDSQQVADRLRLGPATVLTVGGSIVDPPTTVVRYVGSPA